MTELEASTCRAENELSKLTILCPTVGRPCVARTLASARQQLAKGDEFWLISDGPVSSELRAIWQASGIAGQLIELANGPSHDWGHTPRNLSLPIVKSGYVLHIDDDDVFAPDALATVRRAIIRHPGNFFMFRMAYPNGSCLWQSKTFQLGNIGTPMFVHPAGIRYGVWAPVYGGDARFIEETTRANPERAVRWMPEVIVRIRPSSDAQERVTYFPPPPEGPKFDLGGIGIGSEWQTVNLMPPADLLSDFTALDSYIPKDESVAEFRLSHALEHIPSVHYADFLRSLYRKLVPGGIVRIEQSDAEAVIRQFVAGELSFRAMRTVLFTPSDRLRLNPHHLHFNMWNVEELRRDFHAAGFTTAAVDGGKWTFVMTDEIFPDETRLYHGVPIANLGIVATKPVNRIPNHIHFVFGLRADFGGRPFSFIHYLAVRSAAIVNEPESIQIWYAHEPTGKWWKEAIRFAEPRQLTTDFAEFEQVPREHYAQRADVARLMILKEHGGIYLDLDVICVYPFRDLLSHRCVMGWEDGLHQHLCNAVILAEPGAAFIELQLATQKTKFEPGMWGEASITEAGRLAKGNPQLVTTLEKEAFYSPSWNNGEIDLMHSDAALEWPQAYCHHLWEHFAWDNYLSGITPEAVSHGVSNFSRIARPFLPITP